MYVSAIQYSVSTSDIIVQAPIMLVCLLIIVIPTCIFIRNDNSRGLFNRAYNLSEAYMRVLAVIFILSFIFAAVRGISRFDLFATSVMFPERDITLLVVVVIVACAYVASLGIEAIGRSAVLFTVIVVSALVFIFITIWDNLHPLNLTPLFYDGAHRALKGGITSASVTVELGAVTILLPKIKGNVNKALFKWLFLLCATLTAVASIMVLALGFYGETQLFPIFTIAVMGEFSVFQRLDAIQTGVWILCIIMKLSFLLYMCGECFTRLFSRGSKKLWIYISAAITAAFAVFISPRMNRFGIFAQSWYTVIPYVLFMITIPASVLIGEKIQKTKRV